MQPRSLVLAVLPSYLKRPVRVRLGEQPRIGTTFDLTPIDPARMPSRMRPPVF